MRERASPWFRTPVVTHAPLPWAPLSHRHEGGDMDGACGEANGEFVAPGVPSCPACAMLVEYAIQADVGKYAADGRFELFSRAFPTVEKLVFGSLRMMTPAGVVEIVASRAYAPHTVILETLGPGDELKRLSIGSRDFTPERLMAEIMDEQRMGNRTARVVMMPHQWAALNSDMAALRQHDASYRLPGEGGW